MDMKEIMFLNLSLRGGWMGWMLCDRYLPLRRNLFNTTHVDREKTYGTRFTCYSGRVHTELSS